MPGCLADAEAVARGEFKKLNADRISDREKAGCTRKVYRVGNVVYKLDCTAKGNNEYEYQVLTACADAFWSSPVSLYYVDGEPILCMPYYESDPDAYASNALLNQIEDEWTEWARKAYPDRSPNADIHKGNWRMVNGEVKLIDAAGCSWW